MKEFTKDGLQYGDIVEFRNEIKAQYQKYIINDVESYKVFQWDDIFNFTLLYYYSNDLKSKHNSNFDI